MLNRKTDKLHLLSISRKLVRNKSASPFGDNWVKNKSQNHYKTLKRVRADHWLFWRFLYLEGNKVGKQDTNKQTIPTICK